jgi:hypothetical protein
MGTLGTTVATGTDKKWAETAWADFSRVTTGCPNSRPDPRHCRLPPAGRLSEPRAGMGSGFQGKPICNISKWPKHVRDLGGNRPLTWALGFLPPQSACENEAEGRAGGKRGTQPVAQLRSSFGSSILAVGCGVRMTLGRRGCPVLVRPEGQGVLRPVRATGGWGLQAAEARRCGCRCSSSVSELTARASSSWFTCSRPSPRRGPARGTACPRGRGVTQAVELSCETMTHGLALHGQSTPGSRSGAHG